MKPTNDYQYIAEELARVSGVSYEEAARAVALAIVNTVAEGARKTNYHEGREE